MTDYAADSVLVALFAGSDGTLASSAAGLVGAASQAGTPVALVLGEAAGLDAAAAAAAELGATRVLTAAIDGQVLGVPAVDALAAAAALVEPDAVLVTNSVDGRDLAGRFAARTQAAIAADAIGVERDDEGVIARHSVYGGAFNSTSAATFGPLVVTLREGSVDARAQAAPADVATFEVAASGKPAAVMESLEPDTTVSSRPDLRSAAKVVAGGRGLGSQEQFALVEQLADAIGAGIGASRAAVDAGYIPYAHQVGQTGVSVSPQLYIALGISGAIQHRAGMQTAKTIVAINRDADAPIFDIADFGVVGDLFTVVPQLISTLQARKS